ncbi:MAG: mechanosensitive ion channel family protein [Thermoplasmatota archaeon]
MMKARNLAICIMMAVLIIGLPSATGAGGSDDLSFEDIMDAYDAEDRDFAGYDDGDVIEFVDHVSVSRLNADGDTVVWFRSTGGSIYSPTLTYPNDLTSILTPNTKIKTKVTVVNLSIDGEYGEVLDAQIDDIEILRVGEDEIILDGETINIFGYEISLSGLPDDLETPWFKFVLVLVVWVVMVFVLWVIFQIIVKIVNKTKTSLDDTFINILRAPLFIILLLYGILVALSMLNLNDQLMFIITRLYQAGTIVALAYIVIKVFKKVLMVYLKVVSAKTETKADDVLVPVFGKIATVVIWIIAIIMFLDTFGIDITVFVAGMGIVGLVIALAAQDTLSNFFAGIMILLDRPFKEGDWIMLDEKVYQVRHIGLRSTRFFHSASNQLVTIPNNRISDHIFSNLNEPNYMGRYTVNVGVSYDSDPRKVGELLLNIVRSHPDTFEDDDHKPIYRFSSFGDSSLDFIVMFWLRDFNDQWRVASEIRHEIFDRFNKEGIEIPFPQRTVHMARASDPVAGSGKTPGVAEMSNLSP